MSGHMITTVKENEKQGSAKAFQEKGIDHFHSVRGPASGMQNIVRLQKTFGNQYVQRALGPGASKEDQGHVQPDIEQGIDRAISGGKTLDNAVQGRMESSFGVDFSHVRIHTGAQAHSLNRSLSAKAFTTGRDIFFGEGQYNPGSSAGRELLAHELTHVVQQGDEIKTKLSLGQPCDAYESEADNVAREVMIQENRDDSSIQLQPEEEDDEIQAKQKE